MLPRVKKVWRTRVLARRLIAHQRPCDQFDREAANGAVVDCRAAVPCLHTGHVRPRMPVARARYTATAAIAASPPSKGTTGRHAVGRRHGLFHSNSSGLGQGEYRHQGFTTFHKLKK